MRKRQSHWTAFTYYHPCFDFSKSIRANADNLINIHEPSSSLILSVFYIVISSRIRSSFCYFVDVNFIKFIYSAGIEDRIYIHFVKIYVAKCKWKRFNKSDRYQIRENA